LNLNGGTLAVGASITNANYGPSTPDTSIINFNGGTLQTLSNLIIEPGFSSENTIQMNVLAGGAIISDTNSITSYAPFLSGTTNDGGLTMTGPGTLTLSSTNTYNGGTVINSGTLVANFSLVGTGTNVTIPSVLPSGGAVKLGGGAGLTIYGNPNAVATSGTWVTSAGWSYLTLSSGGNTSGLTVGEPVSGPGIPAGAYITNIANSTQFYISGTASSTGTSGMSFGGATYNAVNQSIGALTLPPNTSGTESIAVYNNGNGLNTSAGTGTILTLSGTIFGASSALIKTGNGTLTINPGAQVSSTLTEFAEDLLANSNTAIGGTVIQQSGTLNVIGAASPSFIVGNSGTYNLIGGTLATSGGSPRIGGDGLGAGAFIVNGGSWLNTGGQINMENGSGGSGSSLTVNSGTLSSLGGINLGVNPGSATFNLNGGLAAFKGSFSASNNAAGSAGPTTVFNWNGGTFEALSSFTAGPNLNTNATIPINILAGGAIVNTNGFNHAYPVDPHKPYP
jgi:autotransporter-associated beta strand protein